MSLGTGFEVSKALAILSLYFVVVSQGVSSQLLLHCRVGRPAVTLPGMTARNANSA